MSQQESIQGQLVRLAVDEYERAAPGHDRVTHATATWAEIGAWLGVSKQAAQQRWGAVATAR